MRRECSAPPASFFVRGRLMIEGAGVSSVPSRRQPSLALEGELPVYGQALIEPICSLRMFHVLPRLAFLDRLLSEGITDLADAWQVSFSSPLCKSLSS